MISAVLFVSFFVEEPVSQRSAASRPVFFFCFQSKAHTFSCLPTASRILPAESVHQNLSEKYNLPLPQSHSGSHIK